MRQIALVASLMLGALASANDTDRELKCEEIKQDIRNSVKNARRLYAGTGRKTAGKIAQTASAARESLPLGEFHQVPSERLHIATMAIGFGRIAGIALLHAHFAKVADTGLQFFRQRNRHLDVLQRCAR